MLPCPPGGEDFPGHDDGLDDVGPVGGTEVRNRYLIDTPLLIIRMY